MTLTPVLEERIIADYRRIHVALEHQTLPTWLKLGLTMPQMKALVAVSGGEPVSVTALGCRLSIGQPAASALVDQLVLRGYAERKEDPSDRRRALVTATDEGNELLAELRHGRRQTVQAWLARLTDKEAEALSRGLAALADAAEADLEEELD